MTQHLALVSTHGGPLAAADSIQPLTVSTPQPGAQDLLVRVTGVALNPVDDKLRASLPPEAAPHVFGHDAVGIVTAVGEAVRDFAPGDRVCYAGTTTRPGSFQQYQLVHAALCAKAPAGLADADLAAVSLVGLTAWELLFEKMGFTPAPDANAGATLLIVNGAGGVGTMMSQLAHWAGLTVMATASPRNFAWLRAHGVAVPLDYHEDLVAAVRAAGSTVVEGVALLYATEPYLAAASTLVAPFGHVGALVNPQGPLDVAALKPKAASLDFEYMFAKSDYGWDEASQGAILTRLLALMAAGQLDAGVTQTVDGITPATLKAGFAQLAAGHQVGKYVLTGAFHA